MSSVTIKRTLLNRKFFTLPDDYTLRSNKNRTTIATRKNEDTAKLIKYIDDNIIGKNSTFQGPFGRRKVVYCDFVASGRSLHFIEEYVMKEVLPIYGNTHSTTSITSLQSTLFRQEARDIIRNAVNASSNDVAIFTGHGCSAAIYKLLSVLGLNRGDVDPPIVFTGPCDHHTNLLPWREIGAQIVRIHETKEGYIDLNDLENQLQMHYHDGKMLIGCFSAVSNITGIETDSVATTLILHQYGALAFWDYTSAAPYTQIDMNPDFPELNQPTVCKDAIFFSGHKFIGGVQTPGILIAKKFLFKNTIPDYFTSKHEADARVIEQYVQDTELLQEGGTAAVVESIRAALAVQLKETVSTSAIMSRAEKISKNMLAHIRTIPEIHLLGNGSHIQRRLPIFSFMVRHPRGTFLHHNFICAILNDVFGIQARAGCACAGPIAQDLLCIDDDLASEYEHLLSEECCDLLHRRHIPKHSNFEIMRPGFARISLPYCMSESEVTYVMEAIKMMATEAWKLLPQYILNPETGEWRHHTNMMCKDRKWLASIRYTDGKMVSNERRISGPGTFPQSYSDCLQTARNIFNRARKMAQKNPVSEQCLNLTPQINKLRWFMLPSEAQDLLLGNSQNVKQEVPFQPISYFGSRLNFSESNLSRRGINTTPYGSPRHLSLSAVDDRNPFFYPLQTLNVSYTPYDPHRFETNAETPLQNFVNFAVGESVTSPISIPRLARVAEIDSPIYHRNRCYSLGSESSPPVFSPHPANVINNCAESAETFELEANISPQSSIEHQNSGSGSDTSIVGRTSPNTPLSRHNTDNLQAYLKEVTKELATEIKSEIREVISKVEDVLESTDSVDMSSITFMSERQNSSSDESKGDSVSANDVAEYLMGISKEMASEVKSEIREVVSAVDLQLEKPSRQRLSSVNLTSSTNFNPHKNKKVESSSKSDIVPALNKSLSSSKINDDDNYSLDYDGKSYSHLWSTINSVSSQDSGINLSFHEHDLVINSSEPQKQRSSSESSSSRRIRKNNGVFSSPRQPILQRPLDSDIIEAKNSDNDLSQLGEELIRSIDAKDKKVLAVPPKNIWKPTLEALEEFKMIKNGDNVLICLSGGKGSLSLLHTILQYQYYIQNVGIHFNLAAVTVDIDNNDCATISQHLKQLKIEHINFQSETQKGFVQDLMNCNFATEKVRESLGFIVQKRGFNVLALGQNLDSFAECFIFSIFHNGKLECIKALEDIENLNLRIIRPFVYVREEALRQFSESRNLPVCSKASLNEETFKEKTKHLLAQQESSFHNLYANIKSALHPLMKIGEKEDKRVTKEIVF